jgi:deoxyribodipyrimidine photo-lyase
MHILWFRRDLRLSDNEIVAEATADFQAVLPCFMIDPWFYVQPDISKSRVKFLFLSLEDLAQRLLQHGSQLYLWEGNSVAICKKLTQELLSQGYRPKLYFNRDVQVEYGVDRDRQITNYYQQMGLDVHLGLNNFLQIDDERRNQWHREYYAYLHKPTFATPQRINTPALSLNLPQITFDELKHKYRHFWEIERIHFLGGETAAQSTLATFLEHRYHGYHWKLSRPWLAQQGSTSRLSPHLAFGTISAREVYQHTRTRIKQLDDPKSEFSLKAFIDRLRWRDSFTQRLYFHPEIASKNRFPEFDQWYQHDKLKPEKQELLEAWMAGETGFPLVDASMRQLKEMGWFNFRMRAMCATFLTINCGISWHHGAKHYMNFLIDGDLAIDNWQWQMQAGVTNPLSDTFRIYNPTKNISEKDASLHYIHYWIPELRGYNLSEVINRDYIGESPYTTPILNWAQTRKINGKIVSDLRQQVRQRLEKSQDSESDRA